MTAAQNLSEEEARDLIRAWLASNHPMQDPLDDFPTWAETRFWVPDSRDPNDPDGDVARGPIQLADFQKTITRYMLDFDRPLHERFQTLVYSTIKKSGKSAITAAIGRYVAERWGDYSDVIMVGNDADQAKSVIFDAAIRSMVLDPQYDQQRKELMMPDGSTEWRMIRASALHIPNNGKLRPIAQDYRGEAGANPTASIWTEIWGADQERARRLYDELTPPPTRPRSIRLLEGYAGFEGESVLWREIWDRAQKEGRQLTRGELDPYGGWPFEGDPPIWVNETSRMCAYIDTGIPARRLPWQLGQAGALYYKSQEANERPDSFRRLHHNEWVSSVSEFIPSAWWLACQESPDRVIADKVARRLSEGEKNVSKGEPIVIGVDGAVTGDCAALVGVCRDPMAPEKVRVLFAKIWTPTPGHPLDYSATIEPELKRLCSLYNVVQIAYDPYQLHKLMTDLSREGIAWCRPFNQAAERSRSDKQLYDLIRDRRIVHPGLPDLNEHIHNAAAKHAPDEDTRLRIIKKAQAMKIDAAVALSMACAECLRLNLS